MSYPYCEYCGMFCSDTICETCWKWGKHIKMKQVKLIKSIPIRIKDEHFNADIGTIFEVIETKEKELIGLSYKLKYKNTICNGWYSKSCFTIN